MIDRVVNALCEAMIRIEVLNSRGHVEKIEAVIDTGFNGSLTLPSEAIARLNLSWRTRGSAILANGTEDQFDIYAATIIWDGMPRHILVENVEAQPLVGMALLYGYDLHVQVVENGRVIIQALEQSGEEST